MLKRLRYQNFQAHRDSVLELHPGVNVIIGDNDSGKSTLIRGIGSLTQGEAMEPRLLAMRDKLQCIVTAEFDDVIVSRHRTENADGKLVTGSNFIKLTVGGQTREIKSLRGGYPDYLLDALRMHCVKFDGVDPFSLNIHSQEDGPFLLGKEFSAATRLKVIGTVTDQHLFDVCLREVNIDRKAKEKEADVLDKLRDDAKESLRGMDGEIEWADLASQLTKFLGMVAKCRESLEFARAWLSDCRGLRTRKGILQRSMVLLKHARLVLLDKDIGFLLDMSDSRRQNEELIVAWGSTRSRLDRVDRRLRHLDTSALDQLELDIGILQGLRTDTAEALLHEWRRHRRLQRQVDTLLNHLDNLPDLATLEATYEESQRSLSEGIALQKDYDRLTRDGKALEVRGRDLEAERGTVQEAYAKLISGTNVCPFWDKVKFQGFCKKRLEEFGV